MPRIAGTCACASRLLLKGAHCASPPQAIANIVAQCGGACIGSLLLWGTSDLRRESSSALPKQGSSLTARRVRLLLPCLLCAIQPSGTSPQHPVAWHVSTPERTHHLPQSLMIHSLADGGLGANSVGAAYSVGNAVLGEIVCTFILVCWLLLPSDWVGHLHCT